MNGSGLKGTECTNYSPEKESG